MVYHFRECTTDSLVSESAKYNNTQVIDVQRTIHINYLQKKKKTTQDVQSTTHL